MGVKINNGRLSFSSDLDPNGFKKGSIEIERSITQLTTRLKLYQSVTEKSLDGSVLTKYNKKIQETQAEITRLRNVGKDGFDQLGNKINDTDKITNKFMGGVLKLASALGLAFSLNQAIAFGKQLFGIATEADGIERAFARLGRTDLLAKLREQTGGFITDLNLEKLTVRANNFNLPLDKLGTLLAFANSRAKDTGESVEKLTENIIDGLGRKSTRIIDNLGISVVEIQKEFKKTGDFTVAVTNIIEREMGIAGVAVDTLADKTNRLSTFWENAKKKFANFFFDNSENADNNVIAKLTENGLKNIAKFTQATDEERQAQLQKQSETIAKLSARYKDLKNVTEDQVKRFKGDEDGFAKFTETRQKDIKTTGEQLVAAQNVYNAFKKQNDALATQERLKKNIVSIDELTQKVTDLRSEASGIIITGPQDEARVRALNKQADDVQKRIDDLNGKAQKGIDNTIEKERRLAEQILNTNASLLEKISQLKSKYSALGLSKDEEEIETLRNNFKQVAFEIKTQNDKYDAFAKKYGAKDAKKFLGNKVDPTSIDPIRDTAITDLILRQSLEIEKRNYEERKQLFKSYEEYKLQVGEKAANERFGSELGQFKSYVAYLKSLLPDVNDKSTAANYLRDLLNKDLIPKAQADEEKETQDHLTRLLVSNATYFQKRAAIIDRSNNESQKLYEKGYEEQARQVQKNAEIELTALDEANFKKLDSYRLLFDGVIKLTRKQTEENLKILFDKANSQFAAGTITIDAYQRIMKQLNDASLALKNSGTPALLQQIGAGFLNLSGSIAGISEDLSAITNTIGGTLQALGQVFELNNKIAAARKNGGKADTADLIAQATTVANSVTSIIGNIVSSAEQRKKAEEAYYSSIIKYQNDYNISLIDQIRLQAQLNANPFLIDKKADIVNASKALVEANKAVATSLIALQTGQAIVGKKNAVDGKSVLGSAGAGAVAGAVIGGPVGAVVGGIIGGIAGLFGGKKKVDDLAPLLGAYPGLITKAKDGTDQFNASLAKNLIANNLVTDSTKVLLQNTIALNDVRQASIDQINSNIKDLAGSLGDDLRNSLVQAFESGTDAAVAFGDSVSKVIENIVSQFLFQDIFGAQFDALSANLKSSFGVTGDQNATDDLTKFFQDAGPLVKQYTDALQAARTAAAGQGIDIFGGGSSKTGKNASLSGGIQASITEATAQILAGTLKGIQLNTFTTNNILNGHSLTFGQLLLVAQDSLAVAMRIEINTLKSATNSDLIVASLISIDKNTSDTSGTLLRAGGKFGF